MGERLCLRSGVELRQAPQSAPHAAVGSPLEQNGAVGLPREQHVHTAQGALSRRAGRRKLVLPARLSCNAAFDEWTQRAGRPATDAHRCAEIHDRLGVHVHLPLRCAALGQLPQPSRDGRLRRIAFHSEVARENALHVAVENGEAFAAAQREDRTGRRTADSGQARDVFEPARKLTAELVTDADRSAVEIARAGVVAETRPQMQHVVDRRIRERAHGGETLHEALEVGNDGRDLRLLQHDLGNPDAIGRAVALPRQIVPTVPCVPFDECRGDRRAFVPRCIVCGTHGTLPSCSRCKRRFFICVSPYRARSNARLPRSGSARIASTGSSKGSSSFFSSTST